MTLKQRRTAKLVGKAGSITEAMIQAGYSPNTANTPGKLIKTKSWKELMDKYLPDDRLLEVHDKLLDSEQDQIRLGAVGLGYKVKGKLQPEQVSNFNVGEMSVRFVERKDD